MKLGVVLWYAPPMPHLLDAFQLDLFKRSCKILKQGKGGGWGEIGSPIIGTGKMKEEGGREEVASQPFVPRASSWYTGNAGYAHSKQWVCKWLSVCICKIEKPLRAIALLQTCLIMLYN